MKCGFEHSLAILAVVAISIVGTVGCNSDGSTNPSDGCPSDAANATVADDRGGGCRVIVCTATFGDCNDSFKDGCEIDLSVDGKNCGQCGNACNDGVCQNGSCFGATAVVKTSSNIGAIAVIGSRITWTQHTQSSDNTAEDFDLESASLTSSQGESTWGSVQVHAFDDSAENLLRGASLPSVFLSRNIQGKVYATSPMTKTVLAFDGISASSISSDLGDVQQVVGTSGGPMVVRYKKLPDFTGDVYGDIELVRPNDGSVVGTVPKVVAPCRAGSSGNDVFIGAEDVFKVDATTGVISSIDVRDFKDCSETDSKDPTKVYSTCSACSIAADDEHAYVLLNKMGGKITNFGRIRLSDFTVDKQWATSITWSTHLYTSEGVGWPDIAIDAQRVFVSLWGGTVWAIKKQSAAAGLIGSLQTSVTAVDVDVNWLYWNSDSTIFRVNKGALP